LNNRWPDLLVPRLLSRPQTSQISVINQAAGGNRVLYDGLGPNALARIDRDVLAQGGVEYAMIFEGVNDIGTAATDPASQKNVGDRLIAAFKQVTTRLRTDDITVFAATITPFSAPSNFTGQPYSDPEREETRQRVNKWIRESDNFDEVIDFDAWLRNPKIPSQLADQYNSGDYLHPNVAGYQRIADKFPLNIF
jgi:lysophospholipase L1-like esterase